MKIITDLSNFTADRGTVVTIGTFDGVHCGHQKIIKRLTEAAKAEGLLSTVFTFFPHPRMIVQHDTQLRLLHTLAEKEALLAALGVDLLIVQPFDKKFSQMSAEDFVEELLVKHLRVQKVIIGYDHRFGKNRTADIRDMHRFGEHYGFAVEEISAQEVDEVSVSSTKVREALLSGQVEKAESYLGVPYSLTGKVVHGQKLGRTLGYPTANIQVEEDYKLIPADGVYVVYRLLEGRKVYGMMSIGKNPTIADKGSSIEVHFLDYDGDLYDKSLTVYFIKYLRAEQKFASVAALQQQIEQDEEQSRKAIALR